MSVRPLLLALLPVVAACPDPVAAAFLQCEIALEVDGIGAAPGDEIRVVGRPQSTVRDTAVRVGDLDAVVVSVDRDGCDDCDACRVDCDDCERCAACDGACASCVESATIVVPDVADGAHTVVLTNTYGSGAASLDVLRPADP